MNETENIFELDENNFYNRISPVVCWKLNIIAIYCVILFTCSLIINGLLLWAFFKCKELRTSPSNIFVIVFTALNMIGTIIEGPIVIVSNFYCRWMWGKFGCIMSAFTMYFIACTQMLLMTTSSIVRYRGLYCPPDSKTVNIFIGVCFVIGFFCAGAPIFGWSSYTFEKALTSCSVDWTSRSFNVVSYNVFIFFVTFFVPLIIMTYTNLGIVKTIKKFKKLHGEENIKIKDEYISMIMIAYIAGFFISWTPYAIVSFYSVFIGDDLPPIMSALPAMFAKSEFVWSSIIYICSSKLVRLKLKELLIPYIPFVKRYNICLKSYNEKYQKIVDDSISVIQTNYENEIKSKLESLNSNSSSFLSSLPKPMFKNDPIYMTKFKNIVKDFKLQIDNFNLQFLIDRINDLKCRTSSSQIQKSLIELNEENDVKNK